MNYMSARILGAVSGSLFMAATIGSAGAVTVFADDASGWSSAVSGAISTEDFSTNMSNAQVLAINADLTSTTNNVPGGTTSNGIHRVTGGVLDLWWGTDDRFDVFTWTFENPITALQFDMSGFFALTIGFNEGTGLETLDAVNALGGSTGLLGLVFDQAISSLTFSTTDDFDAATIDNLSYASSSAAVPVPAALPLLATAFGGLGFLSWRRRRSAAA